jgi:hypothetical protein
VCEELGGGVYSLLTKERIVNGCLLPAVDERVDAHLAHARQAVVVAHVGAGALAGGRLGLVTSGAGAGDAVAVAVLRLVALVGLVALVAMVHAAEGCVMVARPRVGAATWGGIGSRLGLGAAVGLLWDVIDGRQADARDAAVIIVCRERLAGLEAFPPSVGPRVGLDVLEAVGHALFGWQELGSGWSANRMEGKGDG